MRADRNAEVLKHMVKYCDQIEETVLRFQKDFAVFEKDHIYQNAVALCVLQIGELTTKLTEEFKKTHNYGSIDAEILWETIENDVPQLKAYCLDILQTLNNENR